MRYLQLILVVGACIGGFLFANAISSYAQDCGWSCNGPGSWSCKGGGENNWTGYCGGGGTGNCHEYCVGSSSGTHNCGGVQVSVSCPTDTKQSDGCCFGSPQVTSTPAPTPLPAATNLNASCAASGTRVTLTFNAVSGAATYTLRVNAVPYPTWAPTWLGAYNPGNIHTAPTTGSRDFTAGLQGNGTTTYVVNIPSGQTYGWDIQPSKPGSPAAARTSGPEFTCIIPTITPPPLPTPTSTCNAGAINCSWSNSPASCENQTCTHNTYGGSTNCGQVGFTNQTTSCNCNANNSCSWSNSCAQCGTRTCNYTTLNGSSSCTATAGPGNGSTASCNGTTGTTNCSWSNSSAQCGTQTCYHDTLNGCTSGVTPVAFINQITSCNCNAGSTSCSWSYVPGSCGTQTCYRNTLNGSTSCTQVPFTAGTSACSCDSGAASCTWSDSVNSCGTQTCYKDRLTNGSSSCQQVAFTNATTTCTQPYTYNVKNPGGTAVAVSSLCYVNGIPVSSCSSNVSSITGDRYGEVGSGGGSSSVVTSGGKALIPLGVSPNPAGGTGNLSCAAGACYTWPSWTGVTSRTLTFVVGTPTPFPTVHISGNYIEDLGSTSNSCPAGALTLDPNQLTLGITPAAAPGVTTTCTRNSSSYGCDVTFDNQNTPSVAPSQTFALQANYSAAGYNPVTWRSPNSCAGGNTNSLSVSAGTNYTNDLFFKYVISQSWIKLKDASFLSRVARTSIIPFTISTYDATGDDPGAKVLVDGSNPGVVESNGAINFGASGTMSSNRWYSGSYSSLTNFTTTDFMNYMKSRKDHLDITNVNQISGNNVNIYTGNLTISAAEETTLTANQNTPVMLIVNGDVTINVATFNAAAKPIAILVTGTLTFSATNTEANGIFVAQNTTIAIRNPVDDTGLKIKGNLYSVNTMTNNRARTNNARPSLFVVFDPNYYISLLPLISTASYNWRQLQ